MSISSTWWPSDSSSARGPEGQLARPRARSRGRCPAVTHRDPQPRPAGRVMSPIGGEQRVAPDLLGLAVERGGVAHAAGQHAVGDDPHRHVAHHLVLREPAAGGLEPDQSVDRGRDPDRAAAVVGVRDRHGAGRHQRRRAGRRGAGVVVGAPRASGPGRAARGRPRRRSRTPRAGSCRAGSARWRGTSGRSRRRPAGGAPVNASRAVLGRHAGHVDVVLDEGRDAGEPATARVAAPRRGPGRRRRTPRRRARRRPARCGRSRPRRPRGPRPRPARSAPTRPMASRSVRASSPVKACTRVMREDASGRRPVGDSPRGGRRRCRSPPSAHTSWSGRRRRSRAFLSALESASDSGDVVGTRRCRRRRRARLGAEGPARTPPARPASRRATVARALVIAASILRRLRTMPASSISRSTSASSKAAIASASKPAKTSRNAVALVEDRRARTARTGTPPGSAARGTAASPCDAHRPTRCRGSRASRPGRRAHGQRAMPSSPISGPHRTPDAVTASVDRTAAGSAASVQRRSLSRALGSGGAGIGGRSVAGTTPNRPSATSASPRPSRRGDLVPATRSRHADDLLVGAADEVPPHHDRLAERRTAEEQQPDGLVVRRERQRRASRAGRRRGRPGLVSTPPTVERRRRRPGRRARRSGRRRARASCRRRAAISAPSSGVCVATGEVSPSSEPRKTRASQPGPAHRRGRVVLEGGVDERGCASGSATQSWAPCSVVVVGGETSEWLMPRPAVIRLTSPGRTIAWWPALSRCSISPVKSQLTVCSPVCGCGGDDHAAAVGDLVGAVVVDEAPGADQRPLALRQRAAYAHRPRPAERDLARRHDLDAASPARSRQSSSAAVVLEVAHGQVARLEAVRSRRWRSARSPASRRRGVGAGAWSLPAAGRLEPDDRPTSRSGCCCRSAMESSGTSGLVSG